MIYLIDGPDGSGKTTLAEKILATTIGSRKMHFSNPKNDEEAFGYWKVYSAALTSVKPGETVVFDRSWISDMVYGPVIRGRIEMTDIMAELLFSQVIAQGGGMIIYCSAHINTLWQRCCKRGEIFVKTKEQLLALSNKYAEVVPKITTLPVVWFDTTRR